MNIGVIGSGNVGRTLGGAFSKAGHTVVYGVRDPAATPGGKSLQTTIDSSDLILIALPFAVTIDVLAGLEGFAGKVILDATNPIKPDFSGIYTIDGLSAGETIAHTLPGAHVVKAFNTVGFNIMHDPEFPDGKPSMLIAGDDASAKATVSELANGIGFQAEDAGPITQSGLLENLAWLWITMAVKFGHGREIAFRLQKR